MMKYERSTESMDWALEQALAHHTPITDNGIRVIVVATEDPLVVQGEECVACIKLVGGLNAYLAQQAGTVEAAAKFPVIVVNSGQWAHLTDAQRTACMDHELCHLTIAEKKSGDLLLGTRPHDLEEFREVVYRHGLWRETVRDWHQLMLDIPAPDTTEEAIQRARVDLSRDPVIAQAVANLAPRPGDGLGSVTISTVGTGKDNKSVTLRASDRPRLTAAVRKLAHA